MTDTDGSFFDLLTIAPGNGPKFMVRLKADGELEYGPDYTPDEAARVFWEAIRDHAPGPSLAVQVRLASIVVHVQEHADPKLAVPEDLDVARQLANDPLVTSWVASLDPALLPVKRS
jgi:hypothetical protein